MACELKLNSSKKQALRLIAQDAAREEIGQRVLGHHAAGEREDASFPRRDAIDLISGEDVGSELVKELQFGMGALRVMRHGVIKPAELCA